MYVTIDDLGREVRNLAELAPGGGTVQEYADYHIAAAQREVDGALGGMFDTPFAIAPDIVKSAALDLACYHALRPAYVKESPAVSDWVDDYRKRAERKLDDILNGRVRLSVGGSAGGAISNTSGLKRSFAQTKYSTDGQVAEPGNLEVV